MPAALYLFLPLQNKCPGMVLQNDYQPEQVWSLRKNQLEGQTHDISEDQGFGVWGYYSLSLFLHPLNGAGIPASELRSRVHEEHL